MCGSGRSRLTLVNACGSRGVPHAGAAHLTVVVISRVHGPLKALFVPPFATFDALLGAMGGDVGWRLPVTARGRLPASMGRAKHGCLIAGGALGGDAARLRKHVPEEVAMSVLSWSLRAALGQHARATLASLGLPAPAGPGVMMGLSRPVPARTELGVELDQRQ
jgi:hypothetical protein